ncbi:hypothetical protein EPO34_00460 [Patescibacteria group bacterium]|nr:MAG: hypothetical protein EPO34_00460 [Patescibacteria group bacterium]
MNLRRRHEREKGKEVEVFPMPGHSNKGTPADRASALRTILAFARPVKRETDFVEQAAKRQMAFSPDGRHMCNVVSAGNGTGLRRLLHSSSVRGRSSMTSVDRFKDVGILDVHEHGARIWAITEHDWVGVLDYDALSGHATAVAALAECLSVIRTDRGVAVCGYHRCPSIDGHPPHPMAWRVILSSGKTYDVNLRTDEETGAALKAETSSGPMPDGGVRVARHDEDGWGRFVFTPEASQRVDLQDAPAVHSIPLGDGFAQFLAKGSRYSILLGDMRIEREGGLEHIWVSPNRSWALVLEVIGSSNESGKVIRQMSRIDADGSVQAFGEAGTFCLGHDAVSWSPDGRHAALRVTETLDDGTRDVVRLSSGSEADLPLPHARVRECLVDDDGELEGCTMDADGKTRVMVRGYAYGPYAYAENLHRASDGRIAFNAISVDRDAAILVTVDD